jgi:hypothetical protein
MGVELMKTLRPVFEYVGSPYKVARWATEEECELLYTIICKDQVKNVVEIGTANGWTACWMACSGTPVLTFDAHERQKIYLDSRFPMPELKELITAKVIPSPECFQDFERPEGKVLWFIDGGHETTYVQADFYGIKPYLKDGDIIIFHDSRFHRSVPSVVSREVMQFLPTKALRYEYQTRNGMIRIDWRTKDGELRATAD